MENDKSIMLQKQVRNNSEDLQSEFLDMKNWEEQMRKADLELRDAGGDQIFSPIRKKKKAPKTTQNSQNKVNAAKSKRIRSSDYSAWENFDADKACEAVGEGNESDEPAEDPLSKEELEKNHADATEHKVKGNVFVQKQQWAKAIACYNEAIKLFPYDAVFFANRALCHLKIDNLYSAEADCTAAVQLDECYVKAYHRRATARIELKQYKEAAEDVKRILKLEPANKEAQSMLSKVNKLIDSAKPLIISSTREGTEDQVIEKKIGQKLWGQKTQNNKTGDSDEPKKPKEVLVEESTKDKLSSDVLSCEKKIAEPEKPIITESKTRLPEWLPEKQTDVGIVKVITKPPHQRSKKSLRTLPIEEIEFGAGKQSVKDLPTDSSKPLARSGSKLDEVSKSDVEKSLQTLPIEEIESGAGKQGVKDPPIDSSKALAERCSKPEAVSTRLLETEANTEDIPETPKTAVQFLLTWRINKSTAYRYKYFKQIPAERIPTLFQDSMESNTFSEIVDVLRLEFTSRKEPVFNYLRHLSEVKRFRTLTMFMSKTDKENLHTLFDYAKTVEAQPDDVVEELRIKYEM